MTIKSTLLNALCASDTELMDMQLIPHNLYRFSKYESINGINRGSHEVLETKSFCCVKKALTYALSLSEYSSFHEVMKVGNISWQICVYKRGTKNIRKKWILVEQIVSNNHVNMSSGNVVL